MNRINRYAAVRFINNLANTGLDRYHGKIATTKQWFRYQEQFAEILNKDALESIEFDDSQVSRQDCGSFFLLFHYSFYYAIFYYLYAHLNCRKIQVIVTQDAVGDEGLLLDLKNSVDQDCEFEFVHIDRAGTFLKRVIRNHRRGFVTLIIVDIPAGETRNSKEWVPFLDGQILQKAGFMKLSRILKEHPTLLYCKHTGIRNIKLYSRRIGDAAEVFNTFEKLLSEKPEYYERFDYLDTMYKPARKPVGHLLFRDRKNMHWILHSRKDGKFHKLSESLTDGRTRREIQTALEEKLGLELVS